MGSSPPNVLCCIGLSCVVLCCESCSKSSRGRYVKTIPLYIELFLSQHVSFMPNARLVKFQIVRIKENIVSAANFSS